MTKTTRSIPAFLGAMALSAVCLAHAAPADEPAPPPSADQAKAALDASPRHGEWVDIKGIRTWIVYPERKDKAPVVIIIHEIYGLSDWIRAVADQLAKDGFVAVAPDLISGKAPGGGGTDAAGSRDDVVKLVTSLSAQEVTDRLNQVRDHSRSLPAASGRVATIGFCWGGAKSFAYAASWPDLGAAVVYYGTSPAEPKSYESIKAPVLGLYGGDDARVNATIETADKEMKRLGKTYEHETFEGAGHGFLRAQEEREGSNLKAARSAWPRTIAFLRKHLE